MKPDNWNWKEAYSRLIIRATFDRLRNPPRIIAICYTSRNDDAGYVFYNHFEVETIGL